MTKRKNAPGATKTPLSSPAVAQDVVARAYAKVIQKADLTREEREALKRHEREKEERLRWQFYRTIPQKHWKLMSGRQAKILHAQASRYDLPFGGATVD